MRARKLGGWICLGAASALVACGGDNSVGVGTDGGGDGGGGADATFDAPVFDDGGLDGPASCGDAASMQTDPNNCGACGHACSSGTCDKGQCVCPPYQAECNGKCIPITVDPKNCGGCGVTCSPNQACSAGTCSGSCLAGLDACNGFCVDLKSDNDNCGKCGTVCGKNQGCVDGACQNNALLLGPGPNGCVNGGPPIDFHDGNNTTCSGNVAQTTFDWALCSCTDVTLSSSFVTDGFDSSNKSQGKFGAGVGLDGKFSASSMIDVGGDLWASSSGGLTSTSDSLVHQELHTGGNLTTATFDVTGDGYVVGDVTGSKLTFGKTLHVSPSSQVSGGVTYGQLVKGAVTVPPPCDCSKPLPIGAFVASAKKTNDDALVGLDPTILTAASSKQPARIDLPCGVYYLDAIDAKGPLVIYAHGHTALFVGADVKTGSFIAFGLDPTASFDVVIGGTLDTTALFKIGSPNYPALSRTYVGTTGNLTITSNGVFATNFYAGQANVLITSNNDTFGSIFAGNFTDTSDATIHYDRAVTSVGDTCPKPKPDGGTPTCGSCKDCGNQACVNGSCGQCTSSAQCCPPLVCANGTCVLPPN